jgi:nitroreductase
MMNIQDLRTLVQGRRSIRGYDEKREVSDEAIRALLDCARWALSGGNGQPWEFIVVRDKDTRHKIADYYLKQLEQKREMDLAVRHAPVHIVIVGDPRVQESYPIRTKLEKAESHCITGPRQCHSFDSFGRDIRRPGFAVCQRRQLAIHGNAA